MKADEAKKLANGALEDLATALKNGKSETLTAYLGALARFHDYSFGNVMLIAMQKPDATHVAGFQTWKKLGRWVNKGEKGIVIIAPLVGKKRDASEEEGPALYGFRAVYVFDISQTDGEPLPDLASTQGDPGPYTGRLKALVAARGIELHYEADLGGALGQSAGGTIRILQDLEPAEEFAVLVHEVAHELLHHNNGRRPPKLVRETEAEAVAAVVSQAVGLQSTAAASDYIQLYQGSSETLADSLQHIQQAATLIIEALAPGD
jgi:hypothetical protein